MECFCSVFAQFCSFLAFLGKIVDADVVAAALVACILDCINVVSYSVVDLRLLIDFDFVELVCLWHLNLSRIMKYDKN